jgi:hypothetical protein
MNNQRYKITQNGDWPAMHHVIIQFLNNCYNLSHIFKEENIFPYFELKGPNIGFNKQTLTLDNVWDYYFNQPPVEDFNFNKTHEGGGHFVLSNINPLLIKLYSELDKKYFIYKDNIIDVVNKFKKNNFKNKNIGVHFRASDTLYDNSRPNVPLKLYKESILKVIHEYDVIFLSTDSKESLDYFKSHFKDKVVYRDHYRISYDNHKGIHKSPPNPYEQGLEAIVDSLLLSECDLIIKPESNLSAYSVIRKGGGKVHQIDTPLANCEYHTMYFSNNIKVLNEYYYIKELEPKNIETFILESQEFETKKRELFKNYDIPSYHSLLKEYLFN